MSKNEPQLIYKDDRLPYLNLITKGIPVYDCLIKNNSKLKDLCKTKDCTKCKNAEAYGRSEPILNPGTHKLPQEILKRYQNPIWRRLKPLNENARYRFLIVEIPTKQKCSAYIMRNGSNIGKYNFAIIYQNTYYWAKNVDTALDCIDLMITPKQDIPLLIGRLKTEEAIKKLEKQMRG